MCPEENGVIFVSKRAFLWHCSVAPQRGWCCTPVFVLWMVGVVWFVMELEAENN